GGRLPFVSVLESLGTLYTDRGALIRLIAARGQVLASIEEASLEASGDVPAMPAMGGGVPALGTRPMGEEATRARSPAAMGQGASMND
ncbi:MAG TPA: hypothetical protein VFO85_16790, partial [Vicinamibacteria bacterium]|nr:hypothetical protein [Vicinamibacteria bacterium]